MRFPQLAIGCSNLTLKARYFTIFFMVKPQSHRTELPYMEGAESTDLIG